MDNNGSLYLLSTHQAVFGTRILKYRCDKCPICIKNNLFEAVSYKGAYGPRYTGKMKLSDYAKWSELVKSGQATEEERLIISSTEVNEGFLDTVQSYDPRIITGGAMQKTVGDSGGGEFEVQVYEFKQENPEVYEQQFERCGWSISSKKLLSFKGKTGSTLKQYLRESFTKGSNDISEALGPLVCAISTPEFQLKQVTDFITRFHTVLKIIPIGTYKYTTANYFKSRLGQALILDQHVNKPERVAESVGTALDNFYKKNDKASKNPNEWSAQQRSVYEREIIQDYGVNRKMNDPINRYERLKAKLSLP